MAGYTRQSAPDIVTSAPILALPLNNEFNQLQAAFHGTTGHTHDGSAGSGPLLNLNSAVTGVLPITRGGFAGIHNPTAVDAPDENDDSGDGYAVGSHWIDNSDGTIFTAVDVSPGAAIWLAQQDYDDGLQAVADMTTVGIVVRSADDTFITRTLAASGNGIGLITANGVSGNPTIALDGNLPNWAVFNSNGIIVQTSANNWAARTITAPAAGFTITDGNGVSGNPTFVLADDLAGLEAISGVGYVSRTSSNSYSARSIQGTVNQVTVTNGDGASGDTVISIPSPLTLESIALSSSNPFITLTDTDFSGLTRISGNSSTGTLTLEADVNAALTSSQINFNVDGSQKAQLTSSAQWLLAGTDPRLRLTNSTYTLNVYGNGSGGTSIESVTSSGTGVIGWTVTQPGQSTFMSLYASGGVLDLSNTSSPQISLTTSTTVGRIEYNALDGQLTIKADENNVVASSQINLSVDGAVTPQVQLGAAGVMTLTGSTPSLIFFDTSVSGTATISGNSSVGGLIIAADTTNSFAGSSIVFQIDGATKGTWSGAVTDPGLLIAKTSHNLTTAGISLLASGALYGVSATNHGFYRTTDGNIMGLGAAGTNDGFISVSGATVTYGAFLGSHWTRFKEGKFDILKGTVLESLDEFVAWDGETNDRLPMVKISDTVGSKRVYGTFFYWDEDDDHQDAVIMSLGAGWVRIAAGIVVEGGDLLDSNGDGCAKVQVDDLVRASTIGKVLSGEKAEVYPDGSYLVAVALSCG